VAESRFRISGPLLVPALLVSVAVVVVIVLLLVPRHDMIAPSVAAPELAGTPAFTFAVPHTGALPTGQIRIHRPVHTDPMVKLRGASKLASTKAISSVTQLYRGAFLDPTNWSVGTYDTLWRHFVPVARQQARRDIRVLTAGRAAGEAYVAIVPRRSTITTTVLLNRNRRPAIVLASARFTALGRTIAGTSDTRFESIGSFFFERFGGSWRIVSFDVRRHDREVDKGSGSSVASSPSEAAT
jgi:hypothetical protein